MSNTHAQNTAHNTPRAAQGESQADCKETSSPQSITESVMDTARGQQSEQPTPMTGRAIGEPLARRAKSNAQTSSGRKATTAGDESKSMTKIDRDRPWHRRRP